jgi:cation diffusion facilitator CzcD-associated flavoprotein CzcO
MPFLEFPSNWPVFPDKDQLADFLEFYSRTLDLQIWLGTEFQSAQYDDKLGRWTIEAIGNNGERRRLRPRHLIYAGNAHVLKYPIIPTFQGQDEFKGLLYHATDHTDAAAMPNIHGKKVVVIGSATTAHDICQDFVEAGADVTMIQRNSTFVLSTEAAAQIAVPPPEEGLSFDDYILGLQSLPTFVLLGMMSGVTARMLQHDGQLIEALDKTEFLVAKGEDGQSFFSRGVMRRGGFYVNEGASDNIASGKIKVMQCTQGVKHLTATGLVLADDRSTDADIIVLATSWKMFEDVKKEIMGETVARCTNRTWGVDEEGEQGSVSIHNLPGSLHSNLLIQKVYRPTGHPGFWVAISNFIGSKIGAPLLALQIKAREEGIVF